jgi:hypothetical protein
MATLPYNRKRLKRLQELKKKAEQKLLKLQNKNKQAFFELASSQSAFLPPVGKHNQGKLFTKK